MSERGHSLKLFDDLELICARPRAFEFYTAADLWTDEHISQQMLEFHLNDEVDAASRHSQFIDRSVSWLVNRFDVGPDTRVIDFGCGPGHYTTRLAKHGAIVTGVDFSSNSLEYAREQAASNDLHIEYLHGNYLELPIDGQFDLILMIMCDFCALSPAQRATMLKRFADLLSPGGRIVLDVYSKRALERRSESSTFERNLMNGFWSDEPYFGFLNIMKYDEELVVLDKYTVVEKNRTREIYNWLQYFTATSITDEFQRAGLRIEERFANVAGDPFDANADEFAVVAAHAAG